MADGQAVNPGGQANNPGGQAVNPGGQAVNPGGQANNPGGQAVNPGGQAISPGGQEVNPGGQAVKILFVGDLVGDLGRKTLMDCLPALREAHDPTFVVVNGENSAGGLGITPRIARSLFDAGVDAITLGNHAYHRREVYAYLDEEPRIVRPANYLRSQPGHGTCAITSSSGITLGVVNLSGNVFVKAGKPAFTEIEVALGDLAGTDHVLVDMHAEATSEKVGLGWHLDGRVTAVVGTHTHIPTADARVLPGGTAYITDVGMTGPRGGVIGVRREQAIESMLTQMPVRFETSKEDPWLNAVLISCSKPRKADSIEQILMPRPT